LIGISLSAEMDSRSGGIPAGSEFSCSLSELGLLMKAAGGGAASSFLDCTKCNQRSVEILKPDWLWHTYATDAVPADNQIIRKSQRTAKSQSRTVELPVRSPEEFWRIADRPWTDVLSS
jgi:hypothetical protein